MSKNKDQDTEKPKRVQKLVEDLAEICNEKHKYYATKAQEFGYARDVFTDIKDVFIHLPYDEPLLGSAENSLKKFKQFIEAKESSQQFKTDISSTAYFFGTSVTVSGSIIDPNIKIFETYNRTKPPSFWPQDRSENYASRLDKLNFELGKVYRSVWKTFFGMTENPERAALYQMRQAYDHFFDILAPDNEVRKSKYFKRKSQGNVDTIHRKERIHYAAHTKVKDNNFRDLLLEQDDYIIELYKRLNMAHKRDSLKREEAKEVLDAMRLMLEQWIDGIGL